jgi:hypothetical protein
MLFLTVHQRREKNRKIRVWTALMSTIKILYLPLGLWRMIQRQYSTYCIKSICICPKGLYNCTTKTTSSRNMFWTSRNLSKEKISCGLIVSNLRAVERAWNSALMDKALKENMPTHRVGRVLSLFSNRPNWDSPNHSPSGDCAPPTVLAGGAYSLAREGLGESQFRRGEIHCGTLYIYVLFVCPLRQRAK